MNLAAILKIAKDNLSNESSRLCFDNAVRLAHAGEVRLAMHAAMRSLAHSVGILHANYVFAWRATGLVGSPRLVTIADTYAP